MQDFGGKAFFFAEQAQQQMLGPDMFVRKTFGLFGRVREHALAFVAQGEINGCRNLLADGRVPFDLFADRLDRSVRAQEPVGQGFIFAQQSEQQVFSLNIRRAELAGLVAREEDYAPGFFRVAFKHILIPPGVPAKVPDGKLASANP